MAVLHTYSDEFAQVLHLFPFYPLQLFRSRIGTACFLYEVIDILSQEVLGCKLWGLGAGAPGRGFGAGLDEGGQRRGWPGWRRAGGEGGAGHGKLHLGV